MDTDSIAPFARIMLRYFGGALVSAGVAVNPGSLTDPDVVQVVCILLGAACTAASEGWYYLAKKRGWSR